MNMLTLNGTVLRTYVSPVGKKKDTGEEYGGDTRLQMVCEITLRNGEKKAELQDLVCKNPKKYEHLVNQEVSVPVGFYIAAGRAVFFIVDED